MTLSFGGRGKREGRIARPVHLPGSSWRLSPQVQDILRFLEETAMVIGARLKKLRESKALSQGDIEKRTGLLRCYISRVENGHTVPAVPTLEKMARALEVPMYQLFHDGEATESVRKGKLSKNNDEWGSTGSDADYLSKLCKLLAKMEHDDQKLLLNVAQKVAKRVVLRPRQSKGI